MTNALTTTTAPAVTASYVLEHLYGMELIGDNGTGTRLWAIPANAAAAGWDNEMFNIDAEETPSWAGVPAVETYASWRGFEAAEVISPNVTLEFPLLATPGAELTVKDLMQSWVDRGEWESVWQAESGRSVGLESQARNERDAKRIDKARRGRGLMKALTGKNVDPWVDLKGGTEWSERIPVSFILPVLGASTWDVNAAGEGEWNTGAGDMPNTDGRPAEETEYPFTPELEVRTIPGTKMQLVYRKANAPYVQGGQAPVQLMFTGYGSEALLTEAVGHTAAWQIMMQHSEPTEALLDAIRTAM